MDTNEYDHFKFKIRSIQHAVDIKMYWKTLKTLQQAWHSAFTLSLLSHVHLQDYNFSAVTEHFGIFVGLSLLTFSARMKPKQEGKDRSPEPLSHDCSHYNW